MMSHYRSISLIVLLAFGTVFSEPVEAGGWTEPVEVRHDDNPCVSYRAKWNGEYLILEAAIAPGWHTFVMDNKQRQKEKLAGKPSLGIERSTEIRVAQGLDVAEPWFQSPPKDFSRPEIRWFTWGFEQQALFAVRALRVGSGPAQIAIRGQACKDDICKNIDLTISLPVVDSAKSGEASQLDIASLVQVRPAD